MSDTTSTTTTPSTALVPLAAPANLERVRARRRHPTGRQFDTDPRTLTVVDQYVGAHRPAVVIEQLPKTVNLVIYGGDDVAFGLAVRPPVGPAPDLSGAEVASQIRPADLDDADVWDLVTTVTGSTVTVLVPAAVAAQLPARAVWDCQMRFEGWQSTLAAGTVSTTAPVTVWPT